MAYNRRRPVWKNYPDVSTPILAEDLNYIEDGLVSAAGVADTALSSASSAANRAEQAITDASTAQSLALSAQDAAAVAQSTAAAAQGSASSAQAAATTAQSVAADAANSASASAASAANAANLVGAPADSAIATAVNGAGTQTRAALEGQFAWKTTDGAIYVSPSGSDSNTGRSPGAAKQTILAAVNALPSGGGAILLAAGTHTLSAPLPARSGLSFIGHSREATTINVAQSFFATTAAIHGLRVESLTIAAVAGAGHLFDFTGTGSLYFSKFIDCVMRVVDAGQSIFRQNGGGNFLENMWENCDLYRPASSTVPAFDLVNTIGGANANVWRRVRASSGNTVGPPFWRIEASVTGTYAYDNTFEDVVGEQNCGGLIHAYSVHGLTLRNVADWDAGQYVDHIIKIDKSATSTTNSTKVVAINVGRRGGTLAANVCDFWTPLDGPTNVVLISVGSSTTPTLQVPRSGSFVINSGLSAHATSLFDAFSTAAAVAVAPTYSSGRGLELREGVTGYLTDLLHFRKFGDTNDRMAVNGAGKIQWGPASGTFDTTLERLSAGVLAVGAGHVLRTGRNVTGSRPNANVGAGSMFYDTTLSKPVFSDGTSWRDARGYTTPLSTKTANYTIADGDEVVVFNGAALTATLPDPTTVTVGKRWTVKNVNAAALTVVSAGASKTIDGAASLSMAQWAKSGFVSDGTQWLTI